MSSLSWQNRTSRYGVSDEAAVRRLPWDAPVRSSYSPSALELHAIEFARAGANLVRASLSSAKLVRLKSTPTDVVTQTDVEVETYLRRMMLLVTPEAGIVGEESGSAAAGASLQWIVDPLDGTVNFLYGLPVCAVSIAASVDGSVVAGAVADVWRGEVFSARLGGGARVDGVDARVRQCRTLSEALVTTGFSYRAELREQQGRVVHRLLGSVRDIRCFGSAALQLCWVGAGRVDAYFERDTKIWDYAAGALVASEGGAQTELPCPENRGLTIAVDHAIFADLRLAVDDPDAARS
jgi:myo-inositol-1(or 4)-monophosphatase